MNNPLCGERKSCNDTWGRRVHIGFSDQVWRDQPRGHAEGAEGPEGCPQRWSRHTMSGKPNKLEHGQKYCHYFIHNDSHPRDVLLRQKSNVMSDYEKKHQLRLQITWGSWWSEQSMVSLLKAWACLWHCKQSVLQINQPKWHVVGFDLLNPLMTQQRIGGKPMW